MTTDTAVYVGIDVGKSWLDIAIWGQDSLHRVSNNDGGAGRILEGLAGQVVSLIAVEATGGYEQQLVGRLLAAGLPVAVVNPTRVRALSKATGKLAKTDVLDARLIAEYAFKIHPPALAPLAEQQIRLRELVIRRDQLVQMCAVEENRLDTAPEGMKEEILEHIAWLDSCIDAKQEQIQVLLEQIPDCQAMIKRLDSIPGVGLITAMTVTAHMPELGTLNRQEIAALAGLAPFNQDSGKKHGKRRIFGGRKEVRRVLYMACLSAIRFNPAIKAMYQRLIQKGKVFKVAITACMRKLLTIMNAMTRDRVAWRPA